MKRFSQQFKKQSESIHMRASEKDALKERLLAYMEYHPLPTEIATKKIKHSPVDSIVSEPFKVFTFNTFYVRSAASLFAVFLILSVPFVAEKSLPGDALYGVKVQFNEELRSNLALSPYAKVAWETQRLERRISEARLLASEGKLTDEAETAFAEAVKTHTDAAQRGIAQLRESDSDEAAIAEIVFASALAVQSEVLEGHISNEGDQEGDSVEGSSVIALAEVVAQARNSAEAAQTGTIPSYEKFLGRVELESTRVYELFTSVKKNASEEEIADVERTLADIQRKVAQAIAHKQGSDTIENNGVATMSLSMANQVPVIEEVSAGEESTTEASSTAELPEEEIKTTATTSATATPVVAEITDAVDSETSESEVVADDVLEVEAVELLRTALTDIQKLLNYLTHIDVRENVSISDLVPVVPTTEERVLKVRGLFSETADLQKKIATHELSSRLKSKVSFGQKQLETKLAEVTAAMEKGNIDSAERTIQDAHAIALDLVKMVDREPIKENVPAEVPVIEQSTSTTTTNTEVVE